MSGFSDDWLALRESVDHRSVDAGLRSELVGALVRRRSQQGDAEDAIAIVDLGAGSGSNLRGLAPHLGARQFWRLVEYDPALIAAARKRLSQWADSASEQGADLLLQKGACAIAVEFLQADLSSGVDHVLRPETDLVTAAAFFDLVSPAWLKTFCVSLAERKLQFYSVLTYDGREVWTPSHEADDEMLAAFHAHQAGDKGFGPAAGPAAIHALRNGLEHAGYRVAMASSDWKLTQADHRLMHELAKGSANAVLETGKLARARVENWRAARLQAASCLIGHQDILAQPE